MALILITTNYTMVEANVSCKAAVLAMSPCFQYLTDQESQPTPACCSGARKFNEMGKSKDDVKALCECLVIGIALAPGFDFNRAAALPSLCSTSLPFAITPTLDCSK